MTSSKFTKTIQNIEKLKNREKCNTRIKPKSTAKLTTESTRLAKNWRKEKTNNEIKKYSTCQKNHCLGNMWKSFSGVSNSHQQHYQTKSNWKTMNNKFHLSYVC